MSAARVRPGIVRTPLALRASEVPDEAPIDLRKSAAILRQKRSELERYGKEIEHPYTPPSPIPASKDPPTHHPIAGGGGGCPDSLPFFLSPTFPHPFFGLRYGLFPSPEHARTAPLTTESWTSCNSERYFSDRSEVENGFSPLYRKKQTIYSHSEHADAPKVFSVRSNIPARQPGSLLDEALRRLREKQWQQDSYPEAKHNQEEKVERIQKPKKKENYVVPPLLKKKSLSCSDLTTNKEESRRRPSSVPGSVGNQQQKKTSDIANCHNGKGERKLESTHHLSPVSKTSPERSRGVLVQQLRQQPVTGGPWSVYAYYDRLVEGFRSRAYLLNGAPLSPPTSPQDDDDDNDSGCLPRRRPTRALTGKHVRQGTGASPSTLLTLRRLLEERQRKAREDQHCMSGINGYVKRDTPCASKTLKRLKRDQRASGPTATRVRSS